MKRLFIFEKSQCPLLTMLLLTYLISCLGFASLIPENGVPSGLFPEIKGWRKPGNIQVYTPETLYEYINGAAELYLSYEFQELQVAEYLNEDSASVVVEIYRHKTPTHAFGIYSQERPIEADFLNIGAQGYMVAPIFNFVTANYYVKIYCYDVDTNRQEVLQTFAKKVAENLGGKRPLPRILACFPSKGKKQNSEKFVAKNFLGYGFLHSGFTAEYSDSNTTFTLFIIEGTDSKDCKEMLSQYMEFTKSSRKEIKEGRYTLSDPNYGEIALFWKGRYIWGVLRLTDTDLRTKYLELIERCLQEQKLIK